MHMYVLQSRHESVLWHAIPTEKLRTYLQMSKQTNVSRSYIKLVLVNKKTGCFRDKSISLFYNCSHFTCKKGRYIMSASSSWLYHIDQSRYLLLCI